MAALAVSFSVSAMDPKFTDANGDMVADALTNPAEWIDPSVLVFAYTPVEDPAVYAKVWDEFIAHLSATTGKKLAFTSETSNSGW